MNTLIKLFFRTLRIALGPFMLLWERLTRPTGVQRMAEHQAKVAGDCATLALYQFKTCPFCIKVRQEMRRLSLPIETRDAQAEGPFREELIAGGGRAMVPCLRIAEANGDARWLYESSTILAYLRERFDA
jgi:glutaredoxin